jgi:hypothetical protein
VLGGVVFGVVVVEGVVVPLPLEGAAAAPAMPASAPPVASVAATMPALNRVLLIRSSILLCWLVHAGHAGGLR